MGSEVVLANADSVGPEGGDDDDVVIADMNQEGAATTKTTPGAYVDASMGYRKSTVGSTLETADGDNTGNTGSTGGSRNPGDGGNYTVPQIERSGDTEDYQKMYESGGTTRT